MERRFIKILGVNIETLTSRFSETRITPHQEGNFNTTTGDWSVYKRLTTEHRGGIRFGAAAGTGTVKPVPSDFGPIFHTQGFGSTVQHNQSSLWELPNVQASTPVRTNIHPPLLTQKEDK